ncbi:hypothetical protein V1511DRAFT_495521 [Dipodascopsis uninucleata]
MPTVVNSVRRILRRSFRRRKEGAADSVEEDLTIQVLGDAGVIYGTRMHDWSSPPASPMWRQEQSSSEITGQRDNSAVSADASQIDPEPGSDSLETELVADDLTKRYRDLDFQRPFTGSDVQTKPNIELPAVSGDRSVSFDGLGIVVPGRVDSRRSKFSFETGSVIDRINSTSSSVATDIALDFERSSSITSSHTPIFSRSDLSDTLPAETPIEKNQSSVVTTISVGLQSVISTAELAEMTSFDFSDYDEDYGDLIDQVNASSSDYHDSGLGQIMSRQAHLSPITELRDDEVERSPREMIAYVRGSKGWVVERRREEEIIGTEKVSRRAI